MINNDYENLEKHISGKKVIIFSCSNGGKLIAEKINNNFAYFIDNNRENYSKNVNGKEVKRPDFLKYENYENIMILIGSIHKREIANQLGELGLEYYKHYIYALDFIDLNESESILDKVKGFINQRPYLLDIYNTRTIFNEIQQKYIFKKNKSVFINQEIKSGIPTSLQSYEFEESTKFLSKGFDFLIHGSQADDTTTAFSDFDDLIVLKKDFFTSYEVFEATIKELHRLNLFYQRKDITQHHGHWLVSFDELYHYDEGKMPTSIFKESVSIFGSIEVNYSVDKNSSFQSQMLMTCDNIEKRVHDLVNNKTNLFELKHLLSGFALLLPLYFQSQGNNITKKEAIELASVTFNSEIIDMLKWVSNLRSKWERVPSYKVVERYKNSFSLIKNREIIETAISLNAPIISARQLDIQNAEYFKDKMNYCLDYFRSSVIN